MGVVGLVSFIIVIVAYLANLFRGWRRVAPGAELSGRGRFDPQLEALLLGLLAAVIGALVGGIFDHYLFNLVYPHMGVLLWSFIGLGMAVVGLVNAPGRISESVDA